MGDPQISEGKICIFGKKLVGPENAEEKICDLWKKFGGWVPNITLNKFSAYHPEDLGFSSLRNWFVDNIQGQSDLKDFSILKKD